ncbi:hypothetical protein F4782DRAFT_529309 [Xylaria castorea]|nr:hypothetical protein F4782DRAFT_529309 [Xylaria castorea]
MARRNSSRPSRISSKVGMLADWLPYQATSTLSTKAVADYADWRSSIRQAKADAEQRSSARKKGERKEWKAPGLYSPAGLLALLIIAHPDPDSRFKNWMMMLSRITLDVQDGFWKGLNASNVYEVFSAEEARQAEILPLVNHTALFQNFEMARKDIRPYVKEWEHCISLPEATNTENYGSSINNQPTGQAKMSAQETAESLF